MATRGKSINLFLMDGTSTGRVKVTLANWTGVAYRIPRTELDKCKGLDVLTQSGVYFLFGTVEETDDDVVYIGQAGVRKNGEGILYRLMEHKRNPDKDYWTEAVVLTTSNNSFGPTEISYLENRFCNLAVGAKRYLVKNGNDPSPGHITEEKESELEEFVDYAKIVMGTLGHKVFEPLLQTAPVAQSDDGSISEAGALFAISRSGTDAKGMLTSEGFVVLAGSTIRKELVPSASDSIKTSRENNRDSIDANGVVQKDILFRTPSGASAFVLGAPTNGNVEWKTEDGRTLKAVESEPGSEEQ
ncbi:MAG: GIY-YIG nuclease family protein [Coriobacteriales bacterium]|jgi:hypothetical protein|nr:GIY-YIG nuclease family protein [Coriobacteriales bacterium]